MREREIDLIIMALLHETKIKNGASPHQLQEYSLLIR